ncbi:YppE family protein [Sporolactobacillus terrae]|uniref:DUF1798 domain-containing protein n=1 Tax=Sporolactobacillus terrae TaxID=269673 RepID=A0A5K7WWW1_9BACL|nr:YppE family protein [Sporolactobacillus terrae]BBN98867.1 hypothetical protein St703_15720 [Sporolactobacillus terrae]
MPIESKSRLHQLTVKLRELNQTAYKQYAEQTQDKAYQTDFYGKVKPFADAMQKVVDEWRPLAEHWVRKRKPRYVFPIQIKDTSDNLTIICVTAFQKDTRRRRFYETIKSIDYVLENIQEQLEQDLK